jgi:chaperone modulatory protein CbpM
MKARTKPVKAQTLAEAADHCGTRAEMIVRFVSFQWLTPDETQWEQGLLDEEDIARARLILELQNDFGVNDDAIPIILHLVDQLNCLKRDR